MIIGACADNVTVLPSNTVANTVISISDDAQEMITARRWNGFVDPLIEQVEAHFPGVKKVEVTSFIESDESEDETLVVGIRQSGDRLLFRQKANEIMNWIERKAPSVYGNISIVKR